MTPLPTPPRCAAPAGSGELPCAAALAAPAGARAAAAAGACTFEATAARGAAKELRRAYSTSPPSVLRGPAPDSPPPCLGDDAGQLGGGPRLYASLPARLLVIGFGSIGAGVLPLLLRHVAVAAERVTLLTASDREAEARAAAQRHGFACVVVALTPENYRQVLEPLVATDDVVINLSVDVSSVALISLCAERGALYLDTVIEPWAGGYCDPKLSVAARSNYAQREELLALKRALGPRSPTAVVTHGANPGLVSHFVKAALLRVAAASGREPPVAPRCRAEWAALAAALGVRAIHVSERDSQAPAVPKAPGEFVNTWSVDGFVAEACQPAELGWGTHERRLPADAATHAAGCGAAVYLQRPGASTRVRSWCPSAGPFHGFLVTHNEAISIADFLTVHDKNTGTVLYRPTVHYAYHPCDAALASLHELAGRNWAPQGAKRILGPAEVVAGADELGVLLCGMPAPAPAPAFWFGSTLACADAAAAAEGNSATTLQVTAAVLGALVWLLEHPRAGVVEPEEMEAGDGWRRVLDIAEPYVAPLVGRWTAWTPLEGRGAASGALFPEQLDEDDPWQFSNVRVA